MGRLFGTDGVRGVANHDLTCELAMKLGRAAAAVLINKSNRHPRVIIGKDTRLSSDMLENAMAAGLCSVGASVVLLGVVPTPAVAYLVEKYKADAGVMISASHNSYEYNGIKIFSGDGYKLPDDLEERIESLILGEAALPPLPADSDLGTVSYAPNALRDYIDHVKSTVHFSLTGLEIALDCANGSSAMTAETLFTELGAKVHMLHDEPNGTNINDNCGSTHMESLVEYVKTHKVDAGIAFDGDADRCLAVDENGEVIDGDFIMAICGLDMKSLSIPFLRGLTMMNVILPLAFSTRIQSVLGALQSMRLPFCIYLPAAVMLRFIPTFANDIRQVWESVRIRGWKLGPVACVIHPFFAMRLLLSPILFRTLKTSDELGIAAEMKGLGLRARMTPYRESVWSRADTWLMVTTILVIAAAIALEIAFPGAVRGPHR